MGKVHIAHRYRLLPGRLNLGCCRRCRPATPAITIPGLHRRGGCAPNCARPPRAFRTAVTPPVRWSIRSSLQGTSAAYPRLESKVAVVLPCG